MNPFHTALANALGTKHPHPAVFFTGGLDSTVLALQLRPFNPLLVFGAIIDPACAAYNRTSIRYCRIIARKLQLKFIAIPIEHRHYAKHFHRAAKLMTRGNFDEDLPAASYLFARLKDRGIATAFSGMGADEIFSLTPVRLKKFTATTDSIRLHAQLARSHDILFDTPYLHPDVIRWATATPLQSRKNKKPLHAILAQNPGLYNLLRQRTPAHSITPPDFWMPLRHAFYSKTS